MSDLEARIARGLADFEQPADEEFVAKVTRRIESSEQMRRVKLAIATFAAVCLGAASGYGLSLAFSAWSALSMPPLAVVYVAIPLSLLLAFIALLLPLVCVKD